MAGASIVHQIGPNQTVIRTVVPPGLTQQQQIQWLQHRQKQLQQQQVISF